ncbi:hypothetical protein Fmac_029281 [Flemingia macrophylla]|uniref:Uncharacterized protein n=1 Tax=Flemingia macrophylla TaxID=520843 RepID=A0ABD1L9X4_9FABA
MNDWAAPLIAAALFWLLCPGMIFQLPGKNAPFEFMNMKTTVASIMVRPAHILTLWSLVHGMVRPAHIPALWSLVHNMVRPTHILALGHLYTEEEGFIFKDDKIDKKEPRANVVEEHMQRRRTNNEEHLSLSHLRFEITKDGRADGCCGQVPWLDMITELRVVAEGSLLGSAKWLNEGTCIGVSRLGKMIKPRMMLERPLARQGGRVEGCCGRVHRFGRMTTSSVIVKGLSTQQGD